MGRIDGSLEIAVIVRIWLDSLGGPGVIPLRSIVWRPESSLVMTSLMASIVGRWLTGFTVTVKVLVTESMPPLAVPPLSWTTTVIVLEPNRFNAGVKLRLPVALGLV